MDQRRPSTLVDSDAAQQGADADLALAGNLGSDDVGQAYVTATVTVWDEDPGLAAEKLRLVEKGDSGPRLHLQCRKELRCA